MPKLEKTLHGDIDQINRKLCLSISANCSDVTKRGAWTTKFGDAKCIFTVFEKHNKKIWDGKEWKDQCHPSLSLNLIDTGEEVRLCAITAGGSQEMYFSSGASGEGEMMGALEAAVEMIDYII